MYPTLIEAQARQRELDRQFADPRNAALRDHIRAARTPTGERTLALLTALLTRWSGRWRRIFVPAPR